MKEKSIAENLKEHDVPFEKAFARLEEILEKMNSGETTLDESLKLFEEGDRLIQGCSKRLNEAERKVEMLIKNRSGDLVTDTEGKPTTASFSTPSNTGSQY